MCEWWEPEDIATAMEYLDDRNDAQRDANNRRR